jgi:simple sugar transport system permease protein
VSSARTVLLPPALAVLSPPLLCGVAPDDQRRTTRSRALAVMVTQVGQGTTAVDIVNSAAVYYLAALAVAIGFQMKLFQHRHRGPVPAGRCVAAIVGGAVALPPRWLHTVVICSWAR